jgi:hypothetical protein
MKVAAVALLGMACAQAFVVPAAPRVGKVQIGVATLPTNPDIHSQPCKSFF